MATTGIVLGVNGKKRLVAIETELYDCTIIEIGGVATIDTMIAIGDTISWESRLSLGSQSYKNLTKNKPMTVLVLEHGVGKENALRFVR